MKNVLAILLLFFYFFSFGQKEDAISEGIKSLKISRSLYDIGNYDSAYVQGKKSLEIFQDKKTDSLALQSAFQLIAVTGKIKKDERKKYFALAERIALSLNTPKALRDYYSKKGNHHYNLYEDDLSMNNYLKSDSITKKHSLIDNTAFVTTIQLARLLLYGGQIEIDSLTKKRLNYYIDQGHEYADVLGENENKIKVYDLHAHVKARSGERMAAIQLYHTALAFIDHSTKAKTKSDLYWNIASNYMHLKELDSAEYYYQARISLFKGTEKFNDLALAHSSIGGFYNKTGRYSKGAIFQERAINIYDSINSDRIGNVLGTLDGLSYSYEQLGQFEKAYGILNRAYQLKDSLSKKQNRDVTLELESKYQTEKKEQEIALLKSQNELAEQQKRNQRNLLLGGLGITSLAGLFLFLLFRNRQKTTKKLQELDQLKSKFFANISHEFRTPLTLISGPLEKRLETNKLSKTDQKDFEMMQRNSERLLNLVDQLLDLSKLEVGKYKLYVSEGNLGNFLKTLAESFVFTAEQKHIAYEVKIDDLKNVWYDQDAIEKVVINLLSNAFKYTKEGGKINFVAQNISNKLAIEVSNLPTEMRSSSLDKLFDRFYQADTHTDGVGIGLSLVKELVQLHKGSIKVDQPGLNTLRFTINLPLAKGALKSALLSDKHPDPPKPSTISHMGEFESNQEEMESIGDTDILLVVEDNADVRQFIKENFEKDYQVLVATDGQEGIKKALEYVPDLIISDIMMPKTNGLELCEQLKNDERTSHVPIILLTAKAGEEHQHEGLSQGADAYVTKPFKLKLLQTRVAKLIASRKALRSRYSQEVILKPRDIAITNLDEQFLDRVQKVLDAKLTESSFSIQDFSEAVGMSRMQLHRKLKALTGLSASEFVRSQRLKLAASLLEQSDINVSQIGYQVGFNDPSYFTKCFKQAYGMSPSQYSKSPS